MAQDLSNPHKSEVSREDRFLFDLQGFLILRNALTPAECEETLKVLRRLESADYDDAERMKYNRTKSKPQPTLQKESGRTRLNGLLRLDPLFDRFIDHPSTLPLLREFMGRPQLINTWSITKFQGDDAGAHWHRGILPHHYSYRDGQIVTRMLNVVFFLTDNGPEDGCMLALPGSHKNNIDLKWGEYSGLKLPGAQRILGKAGDILLFSEAVVHNGLAKTTTAPRSNLYFNYITLDFAGFMYSPQHNYHYCMPDSIRQRFNPVQRELTEWMEQVVSIDISPLAACTAAG